MVALSFLLVSLWCYWLLGVYAWVLGFEVFSSVEVYVCGFLCFDLFDSWYCYCLSFLNSGCLHVRIDICLLLNCFLSLLFMICWFISLCLLSVLRILCFVFLWCY